MNSNKAHSQNATEQYKRRTILAVVPPAPSGTGPTRDSRFPTFLKRLPVLSRSEVVLTPIEGVIEDIHKRLDRLRKEIDPDVGLPALKTLNQVLSGSVNMQVHGGAEEVCQLFLAMDVVGKYEPVHVRRLRDALAIFLSLCEQALKVARSLIEKPADQPFQEVLENGYKNLLAKVSPLVFTNEIPPLPTTATANTTAAVTAANSTAAITAAAAAVTGTVASPTTATTTTTTTPTAAAGTPTAAAAGNSTAATNASSGAATLSVATTEKATVSVSVVVTAPTPTDATATTATPSRPVTPTARNKN